jgi:hypothetical protein
MIILLNGPPGCGKDTIAKIIKKKIESKDYKMAKPIKDAFSALFGIQGQLLHELIEERKDEAFFTANANITPREVLIKLSEEFMKPMFGDDCFGQVAINNLGKIAWKHLTISDSGFNAEIPPICEAFGYDKVKAILIERLGYEWDSRERLDCDTIGIEGTWLMNHYDLELLDAQVSRILRIWGLLDDGG